MATEGEQPTPGKGRWSRRVRSLRFRLAAAVTAIVLLGMGGSLGAGYLLEYRSRKQVLLPSLTEQAHSLLVARQKIDSPAEFAEFVDEFCARMNAEISPGHHILVVGPAGRVVAAARQHSGPEVERALLAADPGQDTVSVHGRELANVRLRTADGSTIIVSQYLGHMKRMIRRQMLTRAVSTGLIGLLVLVLLMLAIRAWVLRPIDSLKTAGRNWSRRDFDVRAEAAGSEDLRSLVAEFNRMASELQAHQQRRLAEMDRAREIQAGFLPADVPGVSGLSEIIARYEPAEDVAGDLYDIIPLADGRTAFVVLDVSGHGVSAALLTGVAKMALHWRLSEGGSLPAVVAKINSDLVRCLTHGQFVTMCLGVWNPSKGTWTYCAAGHPGGTLQTKQAVEHLPSTGPLLGAVEGEESEWAKRAFELRRGQRLWLYTDGLVEAGAPRQRVELEGVERVLQQTAGGSLDDQAGALIREAMSRQQLGAEDDVTIIGMKRI